MSATPEFKGRAARAAEDDDDAYSGSSYVSDEYTLPGDSMDDDARSVASVSSYGSYDSYCPRERLPSYRVAREQGPSQPVYEAWVLRMSHEDDHVAALTDCGLERVPTHDDEGPFVVSRAEAYGQEELAGMALAAADGYRAASRRGFAARLVRGKPKAYEQDLDGRIRRLPAALQSNLHGLLRNREESSSNRFRRRDWAVVMMREQHRYRFTGGAPEPVAARKKGLWRARDPPRVEYLFVIRGAEGRVAADDKGMYQPREFGNPWKAVDEHERRLRERSRDIRRFGKAYVQDGWLPRPRGRSLSPMPNPPGPVPPVRRYPHPSREAAPPLRERGRPYSRSRSRSRSRSPYYPPMRDDYLPPRAPPPLPPPRFNPFVPLPVHMPAGGMPPLPPPPGPGPVVRHLPPFGLPPGAPPLGPYMQLPPLRGPPPPDSLDPEPCTWHRPVRRAGEATLPSQPGQAAPIPMPAQHAAVPFLPFPLPGSPLPSFHHMRGGNPARLAPLVMEACHALLDTEPPRDDSDGEGVGPPPPAPKPSNLTTPTHFSPATSRHHTGSTAQSSGAPSPPAPQAPGTDVLWG